MPTPDLNREQLFSIATPRLLGCDKSASSLWRWFKYGFKVRRGGRVVKTVYLETILEGIERKTSREALSRFRLSVTLAKDGKRRRG